MDIGKSYNYNHARDYQYMIGFYTRRMGDIRRKDTTIYRTSGHPTDGMLLLNFATTVAYYTRVRDEYNNPA